MKKSIIIGLVFLIAAFVGGFSIIYACGVGKSKHREGSAECKKAHESGECNHEDEHSYKSNHGEWMKDVKVEVTNIENGVIVKMTSDKPEVVKKIQEYAPNWKHSHKSGKHGHEEGSAECKERHETGKCKYD